MRAFVDLRPAPCAWGALREGNGRHYSPGLVRATAAALVRPAPAAPWGRVARADARCVTTHHKVAATTGHACSPCAPGHGCGDRGPRFDDRRTLGLGRLCTSGHPRISHHEVAATGGRASTIGEPWAWVAFFARAGARWSPRITSLWRPRAALVRPAHPCAWVASRELAHDGHHASRGCGDRGAALRRSRTPGAWVRLFCTSGCRAMDNRARRAWAGAMRVRGAVDHSPWRGAGGPGAAGVPERAARLSTPPHSPCCFQNPEFFWFVPEPRTRNGSPGERQG
jgi:hypothetical protein